MLDACGSEPLAMQRVGRRTDLPQDHPTLPSSPLHTPPLGQKPEKGQGRKKGERFQLSLKKPQPSQRASGGRNLSPARRLTRGLAK